jgi:methyl-accepting chemotaxis protein
MKFNAADLELLAASTLPMGGILVVGVIALKQMGNADADILLFLLILLACTLGVFFGELFLLRFLERERRMRVAELVAVCKAYLTGERERRAVVSGDDMLDTLVSTLNTLLDWAAREIKTQESGQLKTSRPGEPAKLSSGLVASNESLQERQLQRLVCEVSSVLAGDLRVQAAVPPGQVGILASVCNSLVEQLAQLVAWVCYSSDRVQGTTRALLDHSIQLTQMVETYHKHFSEAPEVTEKLKAFMQRVSDTLQVDAQIVQQIQAQIQSVQQQERPAVGEEQPATRRRAKTRATDLPADLLTHLNEHMERHSQLLAEIFHAAEAHTNEVETINTRIDEFAQQLQQLCSDLLGPVEDFNMLGTLAGKWHGMVVGLQLPEDANTRLFLETGQTAEWLL